MRKRGWMWMLVLLLCVALSATAQARKTRDLVFEDEETPPPQKNMVVVAVKTAVELDRQGQKTTVLPSYQFKSGDRVKFVYTTNVDAYVYWVSQGTSGDYFMLFPNPKAGTDNFVKKNQISTIPVKGSFKFTGKKGVEKILLILSPQKIPELEEASKEAAVRGGRVKGASNKIGKVQNKNKAKRTSRDLVFEEEDNEESGVAQHSQASNDINEPMVVYYELIHN